MLLLNENGKTNRGPYLCQGNGPPICAKKADQKDGNPIRILPRKSAVFNNDVYQNQPRPVQNSDNLDGDQVALFYCETSLDHSESSMLVSAGFESHRPVNHW